MLVQFRQCRISRATIGVALEGAWQTNHGTPLSAGGAARASGGVYEAHTSVPGRNIVYRFEQYKSPQRCSYFSREY